MGVTGFTITDYLARSVDRIALGYRYGAAQLGYFQNVTLHYDNILNASVPLHDEAVSSLSKLRNVALLSLTYFAPPAFECVAVTGVKCRGATARPEVGTRGPTTVHPCRERHRRCRRAHPGVATRLGGASGPMDAVGIFQRELPTFAVLAGIPFFATPHAIVTFCLFVPALIYAGNPLGIGAKDVLGAVGPQTAAALIAVAIGVTVQSAFLSDLSRLEGFVVSGLICLTAYLAVIVGVFKVTAPSGSRFRCCATSVRHGFGGALNQGISEQRDIPFDR